MFKKAILIAGAALAIVCCCSSCQKEKKPQTPQSVALATQPGDKPVAAASGEKYVTIYATSDWTAESLADWITVEPAAGGKGIQEVTLVYQANTSGAVRKGGVRFSSAANSETFILTQDK